MNRHITLALGTMALLGLGVALPGAAVAQHGIATLDAERRHADLAAPPSRWRAMNFVRDTS